MTNPEPTTDVAVVEHGGLSAGDAVGGLVELRAGIRVAVSSTVAPHGGRAIAELRRRRGSTGANSRPRAETRVRASDARGPTTTVFVRASVDKAYSGSAAATAEPAALAGRELPVAVVLAEPSARPRRRSRPASAARPWRSEERAVVVAREEARLLALGAPRRRKPGRSRLGPGLVLRLRPEREADAREVTRVEPREHVALVLVLVDGAREQQTAVALDDPRVVTGGERRRTDTAREREQLGEAEAAVAADARVRRLAARVAAHERRHDRTAERLAQVERHVRQAARVTRLARGDHRARRAAGPLRVGPVRVEPQPECHADRGGPGLAGA